MHEPKKNPKGAATPPAAPTPQEWKRAIFKKHKVWVAHGTSGAPLIKAGKVRIKYQLDQEHEYWVHPIGISPIPHEGAPSEDTDSPDPNIVRNRYPSGLKGKEKTESEEAIHIYADGASSGNPGPAGIGVLIRYKDREKEISKSLGTATNNVAELEAIKAGLLSLTSFTKPVRVYTDSSYAVGTLTLGWKIRKNRELIAVIKSVMARFHDLKIVHVRGHSGDEGNERAHALAAASTQPGME
ncbi:MAG: ribonuclease H [Thermodesulfobacteriota bacterium]